MKTVAGLEAAKKAGIAHIFGKSVKLGQKLEDLKKGETPETIRTVIPFEFKSLNDEERSIEFLGSTDAEDRYGDVIEQGGWDLKNFLKNPVVPWGHDYYNPPVAKALEVGFTNGNLSFKAQFATAEEYAWADTIYRLYKGGYLRAFSVGFIPLEYEGNWEDGYTFTKAELLEVSCVTVPANPEALVLAYKEGVLTERDKKAMITQAKSLIKTLTPDADSAINDDMEKEVKELKEQVKTMTDAFAGFQKTLEPLAEKLLKTQEEDESGKPVEEEDEAPKPADGGADDDDLEIEGMDDDEVKSLMADAAKGAVDYKMGKIKD